MKIARVIRLARLAFPLFLCALVFTACDLKTRRPVHQPRLPYPDASAAQYLQGEADSSRFEWFKDIKATVSAFCNAEIRPQEPVSTAEVTVLSEALFHARAEVEVADSILVITLERPFKHRGRDSIWQITKMEVKHGE